MDCLLCGCKIRLYKVYRDWNSRSTHYSCWKKEQDRVSIEEGYNTYLRLIRDKEKEIIF